MAMSQRVALHGSVWHKGVCQWPSGGSCAAGGVTPGNSLQITTNKGLLESRGQDLSGAVCTNAF